MELFRELNGAGTTVVVITHDSLISQVADRVIAINDGRIVSDSAVTLKAVAGGR